MVNATSSSKPNDVAAGTKRKAGEDSTEYKHKIAKKQTKLDDVMKPTEEPSKEVSDEDAPAVKESEVAEGEPAKAKVEDGPADDNADGDDSKPVASDAKETIQDSPQREKKIPSNILEKGIIYFFTRNRVGVDDADSVGDLQRTHFVLRPLPLGAKLGDGALPDDGNNRLMALPKKVFPKSHHDKFMTFVERDPTTIKDLRENFFRGEEYKTKTVGTRHNEPVTTVAEGVYAITRTEDRSTHLAYSLTIPTEIGEIQDDLGLKSEGSFVISVKNPERSGPANARLPQPPKFPKDIIEEFRGLAWGEVKPNYLNYANAQFLLIGENIESAVEPTSKDQKHGKEGPKEELEELEHEDELRVAHLHGDDSVFDDLKLTKKDYPKVPTTW